MKYEIKKAKRRKESSIKETIITQTRSDSGLNSVNSNTGREA